MFEHVRAVDAVSKMDKASGRGQSDVTGADDRYAAFLSTDRGMGGQSLHRHLSIRVTEFVAKFLVDNLRILEGPCEWWMSRSIRGSNARLNRQSGPNALPDSSVLGNYEHVGKTVIETRGLTKRYGVVDALDDLDLHVPAGTVFGYLGPNGAGKSTTIRMLMGLIRASSGSATVLGHDIVRERLMIHRAVGYLPGDFNAYRDLTGEQYLSYLARLRGDVDPNEVQRLAERFHLDLGSRIGALSHGNRQKVGIVQACMHQPELLILDEPTSGLDPLMQHEFLDLIREYRGSGRTVFLSSHALDRGRGNCRHRRHRP